MELGEGWPGRAARLESVRFLWVCSKEYFKDHPMRLVLR